MNSVICNRSTSPLCLLGNLSNDLANKDPKFDVNSYAIITAMITSFSKVTVPGMTPPHQGILPRIHPFRIPTDMIAA